MPRKSKFERRAMIYTNIKNTDLKFETEASVFSPNSVDIGTLAMLSEIDFLPDDKVLDLGCGYATVRILSAKQIGEEKVIMCDISEQAIQCAKKNAALNGVGNIEIILSDGYENVAKRDFTIILSNPPYHADFSVPKKFIELGFEKISVGGKLVMVTKRLDWYKNKLTSVFGGVKVREIDGYYVFTAEKRSDFVKSKKKPIKKLSKKLQRRNDKFNAKHKK